MHIALKNKFSDPTYVKSLTISSLEHISKSPESVILLLTALKKVLPQERNSIQAKLVPDDSNIAVIGDVHGNYQEVKKLVEQMHVPGISHFDDNTSLSLPETKFIIQTGDIMNRSLGGIKSLVLFLGMKLASPNNFFLCRGNHENSRIFDEEHGLSRWGEQFELKQDQLKEAFEEIFELIPIAVFLGKRNSITGCPGFAWFNHGGIFDDTAQANVTPFANIKNLLVTACKSAALVTMQSGFQHSRNSLIWGDYSIHPSNP